MRDPSIFVDQRGFVWADDLRLPMRLLPDGSLEFHDKDKRTASKRGTDKVTVSLDHLFNQLRGKHGKAHSQD